MNYQGGRLQVRDVKVVRLATLGAHLVGNEQPLQPKRRTACYEMQSHACKYQVPWQPAAKCILTSHKCLLLFIPGWFLGSLSMRTDWS